MTLPRRRTHDDHELPELPPLDGEDDDVPPPVDADLDDEADVTSLDDAASDDLAFDELDEPVETPDEEGEGPDAKEGDDDEIDPDDGSPWSGDEAPAPGGDVDDVDDLPELPPDDRGAEGAEGERLDDELGDLPPLDDDPDGDRAPDEEAPEVPELPALALGLREGCATRVLRAESRSLGALLGAAPGVFAGRDRAYVAGDALASIPLASLDDPEAAPDPVEAPPVDEVFSAVAEDASGALWLAAHSGSLWRRQRPRDPWRRVASLDEGRATGPVDLRVEGRRLWALAASGALHRTDDGARFEPALEGERVRALAVDPHGGVLAALGGRRRDALRASSDGGRTWRPLALPEARSVTAVARAGDVCVAACGEGAGEGYVSLDGGVVWSPWPLLAGATALALVEADDGDARLFFTVHDEATERSALATARAGVSPGGAGLLADVGALLPRGDDDEAADRVERVVPADRAGRRLLLATARGAVVLVSLRA